MNRAEQVQTRIAIPEKLYFKIGEVARIVGVEPYVLRYWETEFADIIPPKSRGNQRLYRRRDIDRILDIKRLLYQEKFTIDGARKRLKTEANVISMEEAKAGREADLASFKEGYRKKLTAMRAQLEKLLEVLPH